LWVVGLAAAPVRAAGAVVAGTDQVAYPMEHLVNVPLEAGEPSGDGGFPERAAARELLADFDRRLARYRAALEAGTDPTVVGQWIAEVATARQAAEASLHQLDASQSRSRRR
jgi:hypothetical protein